MISISHHKSKCTPKEKLSFACSECPYEVVRKDRLKLHIENKHSTAFYEKFVGPFCEREFSVASKLKVHEKRQ